MDRGNIATALTSTITTDLGVNTNAINVGTQLFSAGIVILEIPSNILLQKVGPLRWLSVQILAWGLVATFQAFIQSYGAYLATRLLLGLCEAGFIPGALYYLSTWYTKKETSLRVSFFFLGNIFAGGLTSLIGAGILTINTWAGWRWVFLIEGIITLIVAVIFNLFIPPKVGDGRPLASFGKWSYFTERESHIIRNRVLLDDPKKSKGEISIKWADLKHTWSQKRIWLHCLITLTIMAAYGGLTTYTPSIIKSLGFTMVKANAMASVPTFISMFVLLGFAWLSDRTGHRGPWILLIITWNLITWSCLSGLPLTASKWHKYSVIVLSNLSAANTHVLNVSWLSVNCTTPQMRSVSMAMVVMSANLAQIAGAQIFRTEDAPRYRRAFVAVSVLAASSFLLCSAQCAQYVLNRRRKNGGKSF